MVADEAAVARIASAIGEPARARMLYCLLAGHARTATELAVVAEVSPSTASVHLARLVKERLVTVHAQGKHRYYRLNGLRVARALEGLSVLAGGSRPQFVPNTRSRLRSARACYDHMAGLAGVAIYDGLLARHILEARGDGYELTAKGDKTLRDLGVKVEAARIARRRFAYACLDWSERRPHLGGALAAALLAFALECKWVDRDLDSRALAVTRLGQRNLSLHFGVTLPES